jgi:23S rRNA U2552 (ribose-2'-O)-methylase RlmE/FtsJ
VSGRSGTRDQEDPHVVIEFADVCAGGRAPRASRIQSRSVRIGSGRSAILPAPPEVVECVLGRITEGAPELIRKALGGPANVVLSDLAPSSSGHRNVDHLRSIALVEAAAEFAEETLAPQGTLVAKVRQGGTESRLLSTIKQAFAAVRHVKPRSSRPESAELYLVATGFRGTAPMSRGETAPATGFRSTAR